MRTLRSLGALSLLALCVSLHAQKIALTGNSVISATGGGDRKELLDEQTAAGDPKSGGGGVCTTQWSPGWASTPYTAVIDLGAVYAVNAVSLFSGNGSTAQSVTVASGTSSTSFTPLFTESLSAWRVWYTRNVSATARYLQVAVPAGNRLAEVVVYGTVSTAVPVASVTLTPTSATLLPGGNTQLTATVLPSNASNKAVTWTSSSPSVATVNGTGLVTAVTQGASTITVTTVDQAKTATSAITVGTSTGSQKLALNTTMITRENGPTGVENLLNEQGLAGDPRANVQTAGKPQQKWQTPYDADAYYAVIDLGVDHNIDVVSLYSLNGVTRLVRLYAGSDGDWVEIANQTTTGYQTWYNVATPGVVSRYLRIAVPKDSSLGEVVIYGSVYNDVTPPAAISDLTASGVKSNQLTLHWTAPGDNGSVGTATSYSIRRSTSQITDATFGSDTTVPNAPIPLKAGNRHSLKVTGLTPGTTYRFAIKTSDEKPNVSALSNVLVQATEPPDTTAPAAITTLEGVGTNSNSTVLKWNAVGDDGLAGRAERYEIRRSNALITGANFASATLVPQALEAYASGESQAWGVDGLTPGTTYYFAVKAIDEVPNTGALSNVVAITTLAQPARKSITFEKFMGTHAFVDDPIDLMQATGFVREYHNWDWDEGDIWLDGTTLRGDLTYSKYPNNSMQFAPKFGGNWNFDTFYTAVKAANLTLSPVIQGAVAWLQGETRIFFHAKPTDTKASSTTNPHSYKTKAHHSFQFAARYGRSFVPDAYLTLDDGQPRGSGKGLITYFEDWNEQNKDWEGAIAQFSPAEYAAMLSANYDGHGRTLVDDRKAGPRTFGVKVADPTMKVVMGGLAENGEVPAQQFVDYIDAMKTWFTANRADGKFAADVINIHHYAFGDGGIYSPYHGKSPERDDFEGKLKVVVDYRDAHLNPEVEVWLSEFGWDTNAGSPLAAGAWTPFDIEEVQGQWLVRAFLASSAAGVDRAIQFMMRDVNPASETWFSSSGMVGPKDNWAKKKSWWYVATLKSVMTNTRFFGKVATGNANVRAYKFKNVSDSSGVYAVWCPTEGNTTANGFVLNVGPATTATQVSLTVGSTLGTAMNVPVVNGNVTLDVSERPIFIRVNQIQ